MFSRHLQRESYGTPIYTAEILGHWMFLKDELRFSLMYLLRRKKKLDFIIILSTRRYVMMTYIRTR